MMCGAHCVKLFSDVELIESIREIAEYVDAQSPFCRCQNVSVSRHSIGPIQSDEILFRMIISPVHINNSKTDPQVRASAISSAELGGMSVFRDHASDHEILSAATELVSNARQKGHPSSGLFGVLRFSASVAMRFCLPEEVHPSFCIYDTALADRPSHGDIFQRINGVGKDTIDRRRQELFKDLKPTFIKNSEFRNGLFLSLAPL